MPEPQSSQTALTVDDLLITPELEKRTAQRSRDRATVSALQILSRDIAGRPSEALQRLVELSQQLCGGGSAGISVYEPEPEGPGIFRWTALTGRAAQFNGETTPRDFSPCGICLDRAEIILMDRPGRYYDWLNLPDLPLTEAILVPLFVNGADQFGTLWVMSHDEHQFDGEDARVLADMSSVVGLALSLISGLADRQAAVTQARYQTTKLEALGQLAGGIAHDFNNVLTVLSGQLELIKGRVDEKRLVAMVDRGLSSVSQGEKLVRHLMSFARQQPIKQEVIDLRSMLPDIAEMIGRALPILAIDNRIADDLWSVVADRSLFESAILNLAFNARDAMSGSGTLTIAAYNIAAGEGRPAAGPAGDCVAIVVTDTGSGMTPEVLVRAFEPFYTTKDAATGTGLGLSMVHDFAAQSGGTATIESEIGKGTSVAIHLPRAERLTLASAGPAA
ncbi:MAG TPA: ATP-binding protein [Stellaceae bacterium]|nr:ATP-binding protein [Stellaceae bacterium]